MKCGKICLPIEKIKIGQDNWDGNDYANCCCTTLYGLLCAGLMIETSPIMISQDINVDTNIRESSTKYHCRMCDTDFFKDSKEKRGIN